jgi:hypothetical protein
LEHAFNTPRIRRFEGYAANDYTREAYFGLGRKTVAAAETTTATAPAPNIVTVNVAGVDVAGTCDDIANVIKSLTNV